MTNLTLLYITLCMLAGTAAYVYGTKFKRFINVKKKFTTPSSNNASSDDDDIWNTLMISDILGEEYQVSASIWHLVFPYVKTWRSLKEGKVYAITGYGIRIPCLGIYPNILSAELIKP